MDGCPIPTTHSRLRETYIALEAAIRVYQDPVRFTAEVNNALQALRNITSMLQTEKANVPDFDQWYPPWQEKMRADPKMKWLWDARVKVVHQGDLAKKSIATASILTFEKRRVLELSFKPSSSIEEIAQGILKFKLIRLPRGLQRHAVFMFERKWVVDGQPGPELLDILFHGFAFLYELVTEAHRVCGTEISACDEDFFRNQTARELLQRLREDAATERIRMIRASDMRARMVGRIEHDPRDDHEILAKSRQRYPQGPPEDIDKDQPFPFNQAGHIISRAKELLLTDGHLVSVALLYTTEGVDPKVESFAFQDKADKFMLMQQLARDVESFGATGIATVNEVWRADRADLVRKDGTILLPGESRKRREAIAVFIATPERTRTYYTPFHRKWFGLGRIVLGEIHAEDVEPEGVPILAPIYSVWEDMGR